jgi:hypothetical protein
MKRSEMLMFIVNQWHFLDGRFSGYVKEATEEELKRADVILTAIEAAGMKPPAYVDGFFTVPHSGCDAIFVEWVEESVNKWEPEEKQ